MLLDARRTGDLRICHVADEQVPERVFGLALNRGPPSGPKQLLASELVQALAHVTHVDAPHLGEGARPEHLADDRRVVEQRLTMRRQRIETRGDQRLDVLGDGDLLTPRGEIP
jgi:hypothetical protein